MHDELPRYLLMENVKNLVLNNQAVVLGMGRLPFVNGVEAFL